MGEEQHERDESKWETKVEKDDAFTVRVDKHQPHTMGQRDDIDCIDNGCKDSLVEPEVIKEVVFVVAEVRQKVLPSAAPSSLNINDWSDPLPHFILLVPFSDELQKTETEPACYSHRLLFQFRGVPYQQPQQSITYFAAVSLNTPLKGGRGKVDAIGQKAAIIMRASQFFFERCLFFDAKGFLKMSGSFCFLTLLFAKSSLRKEMREANCIKTAQYEKTGAKLNENSNKTKNKSLIPLSPLKAIALQ